MQTELGENCDTREMEIVIFDVMPVHLLETAQLLEPLVNCLVSSSGSILCQEVYLSIQHFQAHETFVGGAR